LVADVLSEATIVAQGEPIAARVWLTICSAVVCCAVTPTGAGHVPLSPAGTSPPLSVVVDGPASAGLLRATFSGSLVALGGRDWKSQPVTEPRRFHLAPAGTGPEATSSPA
jgi:hypothetical protein